MKKGHLFFALSLIAVIALFNACTEDPTIPTTVADTIADIDGNLYHAVMIGTQVWMVENLKTTHYRNGDVIPYVTSNTAWKGLSTDAWCDYYNDATNSTKYGHLYNFFAVDDSRNIAPVGWHVPTIEEWKTLIYYAAAHLGTSLSETKALAATTDWGGESEPWSTGCNLTLNNSTGFSALPGGLRGGSDGKFGGASGSAHWWSSTRDTVGTAPYRYATGQFISMGSNLPVVLNLPDLDDIYGNGRQHGFSVRCVRD